MMMISNLLSIFKISHNKYLFGPNLVPKRKNAFFFAKIWAVANSMMPISKGTFLQYPVQLYGNIAPFLGAFIIFP